MSEVGRQARQELLYVLARSVPRQDTVNGRGVAQIVKTRRSWLTGGTADARTWTPLNMPGFQFMMT